MQAAQQMASLAHPPARTNPQLPARWMPALGGRKSELVSASRCDRAAVQPAAWSGKRSGGSGSGSSGGGKAPLGSGPIGARDSMDYIDAAQQVDIDRLINTCHQLQDRVEHMEAQLQQYEDRGRDRAVALRALLRDDKMMDRFLAQHNDGQLPEPVPDEQDAPWDSYRNSFTLLMSKGYISTVDTLRNRLMASEWELGLRPIALQVGVSRFEAYCATNGVHLPYEALTELYEDPTDLRAISDVHLRMMARSIITQAEAEERCKAWAACTAEAQRLASQFTEAEFISKIIPDPIESGVVDTLRKLVMPVTKAMGGGGGSA